jgi:hypothetical protein
MVPTTPTLAKEGIPEDQAYMIITEFRLPICLAPIISNSMQDRTVKSPLLCKEG